MRSFAEYNFKMSWTWMKRRFWHRKQKIIPNIFNPFALMPNNFHGADRNKRTQKINKTNKLIIILLFSNNNCTPKWWTILSVSEWEKKRFKSNAHINISGYFLCFWRDNKLLNAHFHQKFYLIRPRHSFGKRKKNNPFTLYAACIHFIRNFQP